MRNSIKAGVNWHKIQEIEHTPEDVVHNYFKPEIHQFISCEATWRLRELPAMKSLEQYLH